MNKIIVLSLFLISFTVSHGNDKADPSWIDKTWSAFYNTGKALISIGRGQKSEEIVDAVLSNTTLNSPQNAEQAARLAEHTGKILSAVVSQGEASTNLLKISTESMLKALQENRIMIGNLERTSATILTATQQNTATLNQIKSDVQWTPAQKALAGLVIVGSAITIYRAAHDGYYWSREYFWPDEEARLLRASRLEEVREELETRRAKRGLWECLIENAKAERDEEGVPRPCIENAKAFAKAFNPDELNHAVATFNKNKTLNS